MINPETGNRIRMVSQDAETGKEISRRDTVKGYEFKKDHYLILTDEDFASVKVESSAMMSVEKFVDTDSIDPIYYDASYYLAPCSATFWMGSRIASSRNAPESKPDCLTRMLP